MTTQAPGAALTDPGTATLFGIYRRRVRSARKGLWLWPLIFAVWLVLFVVGTSMHDTTDVALAVAFVAMAAAMTTASAFVLVRVGRWLTEMEVVLANEPWRPVPAQVLTWDRRAVLELAGLGRVQFVRVTTSLLRTIELTGGVDVAGPGPSGWLALRVAGSCWPVPARTVAQMPAAAAKPPPDDGTAEAADPVTASVAATARRRIAMVLIGPALVTAIGIGLIAAGLVTGEPEVLVPVGVCLVALGVVSVAKTMPTARAIMRLPAQLAAAPWTAYPAQLDPWQAPRGYVTATGRLHTPFGDVLAFELPRANYDLLVAISMTGTVHVAGTPKPGLTLPVGVPQRPVLGYVRFRAAGGRR
ncbi:hypothetical protein [Labedaea rhizosphaerae]|uniref:Uncharacterized protein n=1 Tax=Labedaea rhizosphaerae TaxID=598644 RepID=A0A4R6S8C7_LABRH|nr:hypothetical protein [Labedaea rhizosphaerae]TDP96132.1 hypothetical protein EV186_104112 [Labedaea rhizosphaerae]